MSITVLEAIKLDIFKNFRLIAGHRGLENKIEKVGILDYEYDIKTKEPLYEEQFEKGQFVISSLLFAKDDENLILDAVQCLINDEVCSLAIKNIYYNDLPSEVIELANEKSFPIFIFDKNSAYFEDIITEIMNRVRFVDNYEKIEVKVDMLIKKNISKETIRELAFEINNIFKECFFVIYLKEKRYIDNDKIIVMLERIKRNINIDYATSIFKYRNGIMIISTYEQLNERDKKIILGICYNVWTLI
ncbi:MAG: PucR family transcriptional regulator ligand-binding domain-containing protein [Lutispora sp.]|nr:PucR family transcriptional regulator ligand-binding domain-containing protein [Lutispora sp.]MDD4834526.1 PucR family transcriptional regulator ligand-binding domain-containing protein [Lutispora sp.]